MTRTTRAVLAAALAVLAVAPAITPAFEVHQLTDTGNNIQPCLNRGFVVWVRTNSVTGDEIYIASVAGSVPALTQLTDNAGRKAYPSSHGSEKIVWQGRESDGDDWEIFVYDRYGIPRYAPFTDNEIHDTYPVLAGGGHFAWLHGPVVLDEVHYWNEHSHHESVISDGCCPTSIYDNEIPTADHYSVVWRSYGRGGVGGFKVSLWHGGITDLSDELDAAMARDFSLYRGTLAYEYGPNPPWIRYWDGTDAHDVAQGYSPSLYDGAIAFEVWTGGNWEIFYWNGADVIRITDNDYDDTQPSLFGDKIAWVGRPGSLDQIFYATDLMEVERDPEERSFHGPAPDELAVDVASAPPGGAGDWLGAPRPTPFRAATAIDYSLARRGTMRLTVYDVAGRVVRTLANETRPAGRQCTVWDGRRDDGTAVLPGVYFLRLEAAEFQANRKIVLQR